MSILAIDPGKRTGWFARIDTSYGHTFKHGVLDGDNAKEINNFIKGHRPAFIICEDQFSLKMTRAAEKTFQRRRYTWDVLAKLNGISFVDILPRVWQAKFPIDGKGKDRKNSICDVASSLFGKKLGMDESDAYLIYRYAIENIPEVKRYA